MRAGRGIGDGGRTSIGAEGEGAPTSPVLWTGEALRARYRAYRRRHATRLLTLLPDDAIRPLYRRARRRAVEAGELDRKEPMEALLGFVLGILPLPPYEVWVEDFRARTGAHLEDEAPVPHVPGEPEPVAATSRPLRFAGGGWTATLKVYRSAGSWRGFILFEEEAGEVGHRTAEIFREESAGEVSSRFADFDEATLRAFLRSALP